MASYVQKGDTIDYTPSAAVAVGEVVVMGTTGIGIADRPIAANEKGGLVVEGVFDLPKATGAVTRFAKVYWDATAGNATTTSTSNTLAGYAVEAAASGDATVRVKLMRS
jgi:predicted RecA/RadA family phage recombinase